MKHERIGAGRQFAKIAIVFAYHYYLFIFHTLPVDILLLKYIIRSVWYTTLWRLTQIIIIGRIKYYRKPAVQTELISGRENPYGRFKL